MVSISWHAHKYASFKNITTCNDLTGWFDWYIDKTLRYNICKLLVNFIGTLPLNFYLMLPLLQLSFFHCYVIHLKQKICYYLKARNNKDNTCYNPITFDELTFRLGSRLDCALSCNVYTVQQHNVCVAHGKDNQNMPQDTL